MLPYGVTRPQWVKVMKYWEQAVTCAMIYLCYNVSGNGVMSIIYPDTSLSYSLNQTFNGSNLAHFSNISVHICTFEHICNYLGHKNVFRDVKVVKKCCPKGVWKGRSFHPCFYSVINVMLIEEDNVLEAPSVCWGSAVLCMLLVVVNAYASSFIWHVEEKIILIIILWGRLLWCWDLTTPQAQLPWASRNHQSQKNFMVGSAEMAQGLTTP